MPDGLMQWYDEHRGEGRVLHGGKEYPVRAEAIERRARVPGARVRFDVERRDGIDVAVDVRLREGTRVARRQRRFGDQVGARRADTKGSAPFARPHPEMGLRLATHPEVVARRWAEHVADDDVEGATMLYAPDAVVHAGDEVLRGRRIHGWLSASGLLGHVEDTQTRGAGDIIALRWSGRDGRAETSWVRVVHGEIAEQWLAGARPPAEELRPRAAAGFEPVVDVLALDPGAAGARRRAEQKLRRVMAMTADPILYARVKLAIAPDPAVERPALAQATLDVNGQLVRAHVAAHNPSEAVDLLEGRLRDQLQHRAEHERALRHRTAFPEPGEWRHGQVTTERPVYFDRPAEERQVVRHKTFSLGELSLDEAAFDLEMLGYDFYMFRDLASGDDAMLYRLPGGGYGLEHLHPSSLDAGTATVDVTVEAAGAPTLSLDDAVEWLEIGRGRFVFFRDPETDRGNVVYHRYDGHYGLITPVAEPVPPTEPALVRRRLRAELVRLGEVRAALLAEALDAEPQTVQLSETASIDQHQADLGTETFERERDLSLLEDIDEEIADVHRAFVRLDRGTYGLCEACGRAIPVERLQAMPAARFCLEHQAEAEIIPGIAR